MANVADEDTTDRDAVEEVEGWLRSRGIPHVIDDHSATRDVLIRALARSGSRA